LNGRLVGWSRYNFFTSIQGEPGHGRFLDIEGSENTVIGHDNCPVGSSVSDAQLIQSNSGTLQADKVIANQISQSFPANTTGSGVLEVRMEPLVISEGAHEGKGASNAVAVGIGRLAGRCAPLYLRALSLIAQLDFSGLRDVAVIGLRTVAACMHPDRRAFDWQIDTDR
jgi:hypothetical protein